jgi:hypothetical protein
VLEDDGDDDGRNSSPEILWRTGRRVLVGYDVLGYKPTRGYVLEMRKEKGNLPVPKRKQEEVEAHRKCRRSSLASMGSKGFLRAACWQREAVERCG